MIQPDLPAPSPAMPVQQSERIQIVDILRGFALFGILFFLFLIGVVHAFLIWPGDIVIVRRNGYGAR